MAVDDSTETLGINIFRNDITHQNKVSHNKKEVEVPQPLNYSLFIIDTFNKIPMELEERNKEV